MAKLIAGVTDLETKYPEVASEWHPTKNGDLLPSQITAHNRRRVWWLDKYGHEWFQTINNRTSQDNKCPYCSGRKALAGFNDLETKYPEVASEWHPTKNGDLLPSQITAQSGRKVWWLDKYGHKWPARIADRTSKNTNCPDCATYGFHPNMPGTIYIMFTNNPTYKDLNGIPIMKPGITETSRRHKRYAENRALCGLEPLLEIHLPTMRMALDAETAVKKYMKSTLHMICVKDNIRGSFKGYSEVYEMDLFTDPSVIFEYLKDIISNIL